jgi:hypothetical protein
MFPQESNKTGNKQLLGPQIGLFKNTVFPKRRQSQFAPNAVPKSSDIAREMIEKSSFKM